jgi:hypothetical protein
MLKRTYQSLAEVVGVHEPVRTALARVLCDGANLRDVQAETGVTAARLRRSESKILEAERVVARAFQEKPAIPQVELNPRLIQRQGLGEAEVQHLQSLHEARQEIEEAMENAAEGNLPALAKEWEANQFALQRGWRFPENALYHQWWEVPRCTCPKLDNRVRYPNGPYIHDTGCPVHK